MIRLNLGAGDRHVNGFMCIDIAPPPCPVCGMGDENRQSRTVDLSRRWPWAYDNVEEVIALDVCEHIPDADKAHRATLHMPAYSGRIHFMNELHRILVPGGRATIETPNAGRGVGFFQDPSHTTPWCLGTFHYFEAGHHARNRMAEKLSYGITAAFRIISLNETQEPGVDPREIVWKIKAVLEAVK